MLKIEQNNKDSLSIDSFLNDGEEEDEEQSFDLNNDEKKIEYKQIHSNLIDSNSKEKLIIKFNPKILYQKCSEIKKLGEKFHLTYKFVNNETKLIRKILEGHGFSEVPSSSSTFNLMWTGGSIKPLTFRSLYPFQRVNHFPKSYELTRKDCLYKNIEKIQQEKGFKHFDFIPTTFVLPHQLPQFKTTFEREKGIWIVKPIASSQGRGIFLINNPDDVPKDGKLVVSRYIDNPLLIDGYKFDIRMYVAVTSYDPLIIYLYQEGLARFATVKYDRNPENLSNSFMHLTNYSLNKRNHRYIRCDDPDIEDFGNKWTMSAMLRLLKCEGKDTFSLMMSIEDLIIKTFISVESQISNACQIFVPNKSNCFEVYGFDILVDDQLKAWLLEVNLSPSLTCDAPIDLKIKSHMICDLLNLISLPCLDTFKYFNKQKQINYLKSQTNKRSRPISGGYSLINENNKSDPKLIDDGNIEKELNGLSFEQTRILKKLEEENVECGGFIRIFPTEDTYEFFSNLFQEQKISLNKIFHQYLYPSRWTNYSFNCQENLKQIRRNNILRSKHLSSVYHLSNKNNCNQINGSDLYHAIRRHQIYQKRLHHNFYSTKTNIIHPTKIVMEKAVIEFIGHDNSSFSSSSSNLLLVPPQTRRTTPINSHRIILSTTYNKQDFTNQDENSKITNNSNMNDGQIHQRVFFEDLNENQFKKCSLRVSSAPKQKYQRKCNDISRLDRFSRPISTIVQHTKRISTRLSSSSPRLRLSNDGRNNVSNNEELNRNFVKKLNELSSKQHRRQYSGIHHSNNLPNEYLINEVEININEKHKQEEEIILEKSRQILEENQIKNEQLAKQRKIFQQKLQRNEIYSALNRYSHRPPIYPISATKFQQLRNNPNISIFLDQQHQVKSSS